jgi:hypothetical protein
MKTILFATVAAAFLASSPAWVSQTTFADRVQVAEGNGTQTRIAEGNGTQTRIAEGNGTQTRIAEGNGTQTRIA